MGAFGSLMGGQSLGGMDALKAAMARRPELGASMQQTASSPAGAPPVPTPQPMPQGGGAPLPMGMGGTPQGPSMGGGVSPETSESILLIKALGARLASDSKIKEAQAMPPKINF